MSGIIILFAFTVIKLTRYISSLSKIAIVFFSFLSQSSQKLFGDFFFPSNCAICVEFVVTRC